MNAVKKLRSGDEHYTPAYLVEELVEHFNLKGKKLWLPFTSNKSSPIYQELKKYNEVIINSDVWDMFGHKCVDLFGNDLSWDFFNIDEFWIVDLMLKGWEVFDNPPFSLMRPILKTFERCGMKAMLFNSGQNLCSSDPQMKWSKIFIGDIKYISGKVVKTCLMLHKWDLKPQISYLKLKSNKTKHRDKVSELNEYTRRHNYGILGSTDICTYLTMHPDFVYNNIVAYDDRYFGGGYVMGWCKDWQENKWE